MTLMVWFFLLVFNYFCLFSLNSLVLGLFMLGKSFLMSMLMSVYCSSWYSLMFFMVYMGGLLVLFIYMSSLKFNPVFYSSKVNPIHSFLLKLKVAFLIIFVVTQITWNFTNHNWDTKKSGKYSFNLFKEAEVLFLVNVGLLLLIVLWVITKLSFRNRSALRPFFT